MKTDLLDRCVLALWFALFTGLGEIALLQGRAQVLGRVTHLDMGVLWMTPIVNVIYFLPPVLILWVLDNVLRRRTRPQPTWLILSFLSAFALLNLLEGLHPLARVLLAGGVAAGFCRMMNASWDELRQRALPSLAGLATVVVLLAVGTLAVREINRASRQSRIGSAAHDAPNVLLIILDTVRAQSLSLYGHDRPTSPSLDVLGAKGVVFEHAFSTAPWTLPSHASMFTGRYAHQLSASWDRPLDETHPTLAEVMTDAGYVTAGFTANLIYTTEPFGLARGFSHYEALPFTWGQALLTTSLGRLIAASNLIRRSLGYHELLNRKSAARISGDFLDWLSQEPRRPFFVFLNYFDAHEPYIPPRPFDGRFGPGADRSNIVHRSSLSRGLNARRDRKWESVDSQVEADLAAYEGAIAYIDNELGKLVETLDHLDQLENTILVVTSDHGEQHGERGLFGHLNSVYNPVLRVPFLIVYRPAVPRDLRIDGAVSLRDLPATILDLAGVPSDGGIPGRSLSRYWTDGSGMGDPRAVGRDSLVAELIPGPASQSWYPVAHGRVRTLISWPYKYILQGDGSEELFNLVDNPRETRSMAKAPHAQEILEELRQRLHSLYSRPER